MKKLFSFFAVCMIVLYTVTAVGAEDTGSQQTQMFSWKSVENARKYEVIVERKTVDKKWEPAVSEQTTEVNLEIRLLPGTYRVSIGAFNILGIKKSVSPWREFIVLAENEPYLYPETFETDRIRNMPVLHLNYPDTTHTGIKRTSDKPLDSASSFVVKGRNIYFPDTSFTLVPVPAGSVDGNQFPAYMTKRSEVPLNVIRSDRSKNSVVVAYDPYALYTGLYILKIRNPGGWEIHHQVLIAADRPPVMHEDSFEYNRRYETRTLFVDRSDGTHITVSGTDFEYDTQFTLVPTTDGIPYPFASARKRDIVPVSVERWYCRDASSGELELELVADNRRIETGYYVLTAETPGLSPFRERLLVIVSDHQAIRPEIKRIESTYNRMSATVMLTVYGRHLNLITNALFVSPYSESIDANSRIPVTIQTVHKNGKELILSVTGTLPELGIQALFAETEEISIIHSVTVGWNYTVTKRMVGFPEGRIVFFRPEDRTSLSFIPTARDGLLPLELKKNDWIAESSRYYHYSVESVAGTLQLVLCADMNYPIKWQTSFSNVTHRAAAILRSGNAIRFSVDKASHPEFWSVRLITMNEPDLYPEADLGIRKYRKELNGCWQYEIPYSAFRNYIGDGAFSKIRGIGFRNTGTESKVRASSGDTTAGSLRDICLKVYDIAVCTENPAQTDTDTSYPEVFPYAGFRISVTNLQAYYAFGDNLRPDYFTYGLDFIVFDWNWCSVETSLFLNRYTDRYGTDLSFRLYKPNSQIQPYVGAGIGVTMDGLSKDELYMPLSTGIRLFNSLDFRYTVSLKNPDTWFDADHERENANPVYFEDGMSVGVLFRIR